MILSPLSPTATEPFRLSSGQVVQVPKATPVFLPWTGTPPDSTYGGKQVIDHDGKPAFAELAVLWSLQAQGWEGAWVTHGGGREIYRVGLMDVPPIGNLPEALAAHLARIREIRGRNAGTWDVCCYRDGHLLFAEAKRRRRDSVKVDQTDWLEVSLNEGCKLSSFLVVEWTLNECEPSSLPRPKITPVASPTQGGGPSTPQDINAMTPDQSSVGYEPRTDTDYYNWLHMHPEGFVLSVRRKQLPMLHRAECSHIDRNNSVGGMTEKGSRKICGETKDVLRSWLKKEGFSLIPKKCATCSP